MESLSIGSLPSKTALVFACFLGITTANAQENTQTGDFNENYQDSTVDSNNTTSSVTNTQVGSSSGNTPSAISPTYMSSGSDTCLVGKSGAVSTGVFAISSGNYHRDLQCEMRKNAKLLSDLGMKIASVALVCTEPQIWKSMFFAGTPCPVTINNKTFIGSKAYLYFKMYPERLIPDYKPEDYDFYLGIGEYARNETEENDSGSGSGGILHLRSSRRTD